MFIRNFPALKNMLNWCDSLPENYVNLGTSSENIYYSLPISR